jgi:hypothetical protein
MLSEITAFTASRRDESNRSLALRLKISPAVKI